MSKKTYLVVLIALLSVILAGCMPARQTTDQGLTVERKVDESLYHLTIKISSEVDSYSQIHGSLSGAMFNGFGSMSGAIWQDGKGLVRGELLDLSPSVSFAKIGDEIVVKTTDFKIVALWANDIVHLTCTADYEPICSMRTTDGGDVVAGNCEDNWEFDYCRMRGLEPVAQPEPTE
jgi:hypothetical protein